MLPRPHSAGASAPYKHFARGKILAQGQFICPEHVKSPPGVPAGHAGGARGLENVRSAALFPRDLNRLEP